MERHEREEFSDDIKRKVLLWSDRHCCVCGKACGLDIEVHHLGGKAVIKNALPVCYDCHARVGRYVDSQPRGSKYKIKELQQRRDQIYERYTSRLVPAIFPRVHPSFPGDVGLSLPHVMFSVLPVGRFIPVKVRGVIRVFLDGEDLGPISDSKPYYAGKIVWNLNPGIGFNGNFTIPEKCTDQASWGKELQLEFKAIVIDPYEREHVLLPVCFTYVWKDNYWFLEPTEFHQLKPYLNIKRKV